jgi:hypothetical protein
MSGLSGKDYDDDGRLKVKTGDRNPVDVADDVAEHLLENNDPPRLFSMSPAAVLLREGGQLVPLDADGWLAYVARRATFTIATSRDPRIVAPPAAVMKLIPAVVIPDLPRLDGIAATPYIDRDGNVIAQDGYHPGTRLALHCGGFHIPPIADTPGDEDVAQAVKLLSEDWLGDFPFATPADKANAIAILLTLTGRVFFGLAPLFVVDASTAGSGKGLLVATISLIATGDVPHVMELPQDGEEQRKKITSALLAGQELIMWDESHTIAGKTLAAILTAEHYSDRLLGTNKLFNVRNRFTQVALGNNVEVYGDMRRRVVPARLVPDTEHPETRSDFRHPDLERWVRSHRGELLAAVLMIWRNWIARGRPESSDGMGSFDRWARTVGGALQAAGLGGFRTNTRAWLSDSEDDDGWTDHLAQLRARYADRWFTPGDVADAVDAMHLRRPPVKRDPNRSLAELIAYAYRRLRESRRGDLWLVRSERRDSAKGSYTWSVRRRDDVGGPPQVSETTVSSPASPVAPVGTGKPQVRASPKAESGPLEMAGPESISSNPDPGKSAGQSHATGDTGDTGDPDPDFHGSGFALGEDLDRADVQMRWPEGSIGEAAAAGAVRGGQRP